MTDKEMADAINEGVRALNKLFHEASMNGLRVEVTDRCILDVSGIETPVIGVKIMREVR